VETDLARRFRLLRVQAKLSGSALARPGYTASYISQIESGRRRPSPEAMAYFAERLGVTTGFLATGLPDGIEGSLRYRLEEARRELGQGRPPGAEELLRVVLEQARRYGLERLTAEAVLLLGDALSAQGRVREAIDAYEEGLEGQLPDRDRGLGIASLARAYVSAGDLSYPAELIEGFLKNRNGLPLDAAVATDLHSVLVSVYFERGDITKAEQAATRALASAEEGTPVEVRAIAYWNASRVLAERKEWDDALELATRARVLIEDLDDRRRVARLHNAYAFICLEMEPPRIDDARRHLNAAETLFQEGAAAGDLAYVLTERSRLALLEERPEDALTHANNALAAAATDELEIARCWFLRGRALGALGRADEAQDALHEAATQFGKLGARQQEASCWREIGELDLAAGNLEAAVEALRSGLEALDPRRSRA
jgi:tetratricopeptide (TPR) repeat protein